MFVFDGPGARLHKAPETARREERRAEQRHLRATWEEAALREASWDSVLLCRAKIQQYTRASVRVSDADRQWMKRLLTAGGWLWLEAPGEAESHLAALQCAGAVEYVVTEDSDAIVCGARPV